MWGSKKLLAVLALCALLSGCGSAGTAQTEPQLLTDARQASYETAVVTRGTYRTTADGQFSLQSLAVDRTVSAPVGRTVRSMAVSDRETVQKGQLLFALEPEGGSGQQADIEQCRLRLQRRQEAAEAGRAERNAATEAALAAQTGLTGHELRIAQLKAEKCQAEADRYDRQSARELAELTAQLEELELGAEADRYYAPCDGRVSLSAEAGQTLEGSAGKEAEVLRILVEETVPTYLYGTVGGGARYRLHAPVEVTRGGGTAVLTGRVVTATSDLLTADQRDVMIAMDDDTLTASVQPGQAVLCAVVTEEVEDVLLVDSRAIHAEGSQYYVNIPENGTMGKRYVSVGLQNNEVTWVLDGLTEGQTVVIG